MDPVCNNSIDATVMLIDATKRSIDATKRYLVQAVNRPLLCKLHINICLLGRLPTFFLRFISVMVLNARTLCFII